MAYDEQCFRLAARFAEDAAGVYRMTVDDVRELAQRLQDTVEGFLAELPTKETT